MQQTPTKMVLKQRIDSETLAAQIYTILEENIHLIPTDNDNIGYITLLHKSWPSWQTNKYAHMLPDIERELPDVVQDDILSFGFLYSNPECINQRWHIDYSGRSEIFFIPTIDINETNGTEYIEFADVDKNKKLKDVFVEITNNFTENDDLKEYFKNTLKLEDHEYRFCIAKAPRMSLIKISHYMLHRGRRNISGRPRIIFFVCTSKDRDFLDVLPTDVVVPDAELDEPDQESKVLLSRNKVKAATTSIQM